MEKAQRTKCLYINQHESLTHNYDSFFVFLELFFNFFLLLHIKSYCFNLFLPCKCFKSSNKKIVLGADIYHDFIWLPFLTSGSLEGRKEKHCPSGMGTGKGKMNQELKGVVFPVSDNTSINASAVQTATTNMRRGKVSLENIWPSILNNAFQCHHKTKHKDHFSSFLCQMKVISQKNSLKCQA